MNMKSILKFLLLTTLIAGALILAWRYGQQMGLADLQTRIRSFGVWAPLAFIIVYILATIFFLPGSVLTIAGGLLFGAAWGTLFSLLGATIGASCAFLISRYLAGEWVLNKASGKIAQMQQGIEQQGWRFVAVLRLIPILPFNLLNYALGLTKIRFIPYALASAIFMLPGTFAYTYLGSLGEAVVNSGGKALVGKILLAIGLLVLLSMLPWLIQKISEKK